MVNDIDNVNNDDTPTTDDDIYDDPETIGDTSDEVSGAPDDLPPAAPTDPSQSIYTPEKDTTPLDDRGQIDELELADAHDTQDVANRVDPALLDDEPSDFDGDSYHQNDELPGDERDGTEE